MGGEKCFCGSARLENGNCSLCREDGHPLQCVGRWAKEKHDYLYRYIDATWAAREMYVKPSREFPKPGGASFIDLFAGPGRAKVDETGEVIDGSPLLAARYDRVPFSKLILCDIDAENVRALTHRLSPYHDRVKIIEGDCIANIDKVAHEIPEHGLNFALIDPFGPTGLDWSLIERLARFARMDLLIHFPTGSLKRNLHNHPDFKKMVGSFDANGDVLSPNELNRVMDRLRENLAQLGYTGQQVRHVPIRNSRHVILYHLFFASKKALADNIWSSIAKIDAHGQRSLF